MQLEEVDDVGGQPHAHEHVTTSPSSPRRSRQSWELHFRQSRNAWAFVAHLFGSSNCAVANVSAFGNSDLALTTALRPPTLNARAAVLPRNALAKRERKRDYFQFLMRAWFTQLPYTSKDLNPLFSVRYVLGD